MKLIRSLYLTLITFLLLLPYNAYSESKKSNSIFDIENGQINIASISYELDMNNSVAVFEGDVNVVETDMNMSCQKLEIFFNNKDTSSKNSKFSIDKVIATGSVVITRSEGGSAIAEKAVYYHDSEKIVLTGNPSFNYGEEGKGAGRKIILYLKEDRYVVEGSKGDKAKLYATGKEAER